MDGRTAFPRVSGGIVLDAFSVVSFFTGLLAVLPAGLAYLVRPGDSGGGGAALATSLVWGATILVLLARLAQLGVAGDSEGGLFSDLAGPWSGTLLAGVRLLLLWVVWWLPVVAWVSLGAGPRPQDAAPALGFVPFVPTVPVLLWLWSGLGMVLSFAFVAVAVSAPGFGSLFSPGLWRALLSGRPGELFVVMAGTFGPPVAVTLVFVPFAFAMAAWSPKAALTALAPFLVYVVGMTLTLQGKLCGAFAAARLVEEAEAGATSGAERVAEPRPATVEAVRVAAPAAPPARAGAPPARTPGDPRLLHDRWRTLFAAGETEAALAAARETIAAGLETGNRRIAAEVYRFHLDRLPDLGLDRPALDLLADQLLRDGDVAAAAWTFSQALDSQPTDPKAFKGLLRVAEHYMEKAKEPFEAVRVFRYLLERAPASPFADHARDLLAAAERRAARPAAPQG